MHHNLASPTSTLLPAEVAQRLGIAERTLADWRARGCGRRFVKLTGSKLVRYRELDLIAWLEERTRSSTSDTGPRPRRRSPRRAQPNGGSALEQQHAV